MRQEKCLQQYVVADSDHWPYNGGLGSVPQKPTEHSNQARKHNDVLPAGETGVTLPMHILSSAPFAFASS